MNITDIIKTIHKERVEIEIYEHLQEWIVEDKNQWINRAMDAEATLRAIHTIATENKNQKNALEGIINLSSED